MPLAALGTVETFELRDWHTVKGRKGLSQLGGPAHQVQCVGQLDLTVRKVVLGLAEELAGEVGDVRPAVERLKHRSVILIFLKLSFLQRKVVGPDDEHSLPV